MRIWDIDPGYLNRQSLLGEHFELHGIVSIIVNNKKGYSRHPETVRWLEHGWALGKRHLQLAVEMSLRGYREKSPVSLQVNRDQWPENYIDEPFEQFAILQDKYEQKEQGRIALPQNVQELWRHHKYSVLARDVEAYKEIGRQVSGTNSNDDFAPLAMRLSKLLRVAPFEGGLRNSLQHMWGHVSELAITPQEELEQWSLKELLGEIQRRTLKYKEPYLISSTALGELMAWI
ncbi:DUF1722 domain-containing protein [Desulfotalea psychrophila]|uniref:DUF1722 domain-containing protein n=1 Tax=Desulfotalea psychrophila (strain LSv54 / DSM 12343) TaxID=177439 RepID=Q6AQB4_DESPS|nr:DUF1722 domain-containing protein [Desulfotalea psychrophila]CAG35459.1 unknown protein [Desulfotalea psychrophila LSv54]